MKKSTIVLSVLIVALVLVAVLYMRNQKPSDTLEDEVIEETSAPINETTPSPSDTAPADTTEPAPAEKPPVEQPERSGSGS